MIILAIDPGTTESAYVLIESTDCRPIEFRKVGNYALLNDLWGSFHTGWLPDCPTAAIEMVASYGMAVGAEVFETCVWIGRFAEALGSCPGHGEHAQLVKRHPIKLHHCHSAKANDANIRQALVDRFAPGQPNHGKGTKAAPGWFHGFSADIWQAYALAVYVADNLPTQTGAPE